MVDGNVSTVTVCQNSLGDVPLKRRTLASPGSVAADRCGRATALWQKCREHSLHAVSLARVCGILAGLAGDFVSAGLLCKSCREMRNTWASVERKYCLAAGIGCSGMLFTRAVSMAVIIRGRLW